MADFPTKVKVFTLGQSGVKIRFEQNKSGYVSLCFHRDGATLLTLGDVFMSDRADIAALGFPTEPHEPAVEVAEEVK